MYTSLMDAQKSLPGNFDMLNCNYTCKGPQLSTTDFSEILDILKETNRHIPL